MPNLHPDGKNKQRPPQDRNAEVPDWDLGPEDILQMDILPSGGYDHIITALDFFSRYFFAYTATRITATAVARVIMDILCKHSTCQQL